MPYSIGDADILIKGYEIHWLVCIETYQLNRREVIEGWKYVFGDIETCVYRNGNNAIIGFRGTAETKDIYDDTLIMQGKVFPRLKYATHFVKQFSSLYPEAQIELTGHSLGGAIARECSKLLLLRCTTFNAAAPPSFPVKVSPFEKSFHIVFDIISAWQSPGVIRIDKGYRPSSNYYSIFNPYPIWINAIFNNIYPSHSLVNFSRDINGVLMTPCAELKLFNQWNATLPFPYRVALQIYLTGKMSSVFPSFVI